MNTDAVVENERVEEKPAERSKTIITRSVVGLDKLGTGAAVELELMIPPITPPSTFSCEVTHKRFESGAMLDPSNE